MIKPNFYIIGAAKCATTTLANLLADHPEAAIVKGKEPHFFSLGASTQSALEAYLLKYSHCTNECAIGDGSTSYSRIRYNPDTIKRIYDFTPEAKIIYLVRHPLERIESAYVERMMSPNNQNMSSLNESVHKIPMMVDSSRYWEVFDAYRQTFPEKNIMIVWFEEFIQDQQKVFATICRFLGINDSTENTSTPMHSNTRVMKETLRARQGRTLNKLDTQLDAATRNYIIDLLREDNLQILRYFYKGDNYWGDIFS